MEPGHVMEQEEKVNSLKKEKKRLLSNPSEWTE